MTLLVQPDGSVSASFAHIEEVSMKILKALGAESIGYSILGAILTLGRLNNPDTRLSHDQEIEFINAAAGWVEAYFSVPTDGVMN